MVLSTPRNAVLDTCSRGLSAGLLPNSTFPAPQTFRSMDHAGDNVGVDTQLLEGSIADLLRRKQLAGPAVSLLMLFPSLPVEFSPLEIMSALISDGQLTTAKAWASDLGPETQVNIPCLVIILIHCRCSLQMVSAAHQS